MRRFFVGGRLGGVPVSRLVGRGVRGTTGGHGGGGRISTDGMGGVTRGGIGGVRRPMEATTRAGRLRRGLRRTGGGGRGTGTKDLTSGTGLMGHFGRNRG